MKVPLLTDTKVIIQVEGEWDLGNVIWMENCNNVNWYESVNIWKGNGNVKEWWMWNVWNAMKVLMNDKCEIIEM